MITLGKNFRLDNDDRCYILQERKIVKNGENALIFEYGNVDILAIQLKKLMNDEMLRKKIEKQSILLSQTTFNINNINRQIEELYKSVLNE